MIEKSSLYRKKYGAWAGNLEGRAPDYSLCCEVRERSSRHYQCSKKRGHGPDGAYCKQHAPDAAKARQAAADARSKDQWNARRYEVYGRTFFNALLAIADGHNDARGMAQGVIDEFKKHESR